MGAERKKTGGGAGSAVRGAAAALAVTGLLFLLPGLLVPGPEAKGDGQSAVSGESAPSGTTTAVQTGKRDGGRTVRLLKKDDTVEELTMADYLWGVVAAEMPASFEEEALKAQTCAARTYTAVLQKSAGHKHPDADICADSTCCQAYIERADAQARWGLNAQSYSEKIARAVADTDGLGVTYGGEPIQALFFSSSPGRTVDAAAVWGSRVDYLTGVDSPEGEEVPNYHTQVDKTAQEVHRAVLDAYPGADLSGDPSGWFGPADRDAGGTVRSIPLGGITLTGSQVRGLFSLRSAGQYLLCAALSGVVFVLGKALFPDRLYDLPGEPEQAKQEPAKDTKEKVQAKAESQQPALSPEVAALIKERDRAVSEMRRLNDNIPDPRLSQQIDHLEEVTGKIVDQVVSQPKKLPQIRRFMDYYLPTTLKLLNAYDRMDSTGIAGDNITATKDKVSAMMDTIVHAFDRQLDALFGEEALDISTDITVMENLLAREGLTQDKPSGQNPDGDVELHL